MLRALYLAVGVSIGAAFMTWAALADSRCFNTPAGVACFDPEGR
jgi:hypothetical protein